MFIADDFPELKIENVYKVLQLYNFSWIFEPAEGFFRSWTCIDSTGDVSKESRNRYCEAKMDNLC